MVFFFVSYVALVVVLFAVLFRGFVGIHSACHPIYTDGVFNSVLRDANDLGSDSYNSVRSKSTGAEFQVTLGG